MNTKMPLPNSRQLEWYGRELSAFIHFGMNTFTDKEWGDGTESPSLFNPSELDCRQWIKVLKEAGFKAVILTAKHHDGFCLWQTKTTEHSVKNSPYKNGKGDIVKEFTDACREFGMKAGLYLSPWDRNNATWGSDAYNDLYAEQLTELMTNYGEIYECWWDGAGSEDMTYDLARWENIIHTLQPNAVIFGGEPSLVDVRWVGNEKGIAGDPCFATIKAEALAKGIVSELNSGDPDGECFIPAEVDVSIRPGWFYHADQDEEVRTLSNLVNLWFNSVGRNAGWLLNIPPDRRGLLHENDVEAIRQLGEFLKKAFSDNLLDRAKQTAARDGNEIAFELDGKTEFNCVILSEDISLGQRVRGYELFAELDGELKMIANRCCIGYKQAIYFDEPIKSERIILRITEAVDAPIISAVELYKIDRPKAIKGKISFCGKNLLSSSSARVEKTDDEIYIQLGGIRPFNTFKIKGRGIEKLQVSVFNGTNFEVHGECLGNGEECCYFFGETVDWSYRLKIKITPTKDFNMKDCALMLYCAEF